MELKKIYAGLLFTVIVWGASFVATKILLEDLSPAAITMSRFGMGTVVLLIVVGLQRARSALRKDRILPSLVLGFIGIAFHQWLQANGLRTAQATTGSWIVATIPIFVAILGWLFLREGLGLVRSTGIGIAALGALVVIGNGDPLSLLRGEMGAVGDLLFVVSAINWAVFTVISRGIMSRSQAIPNADIVSFKRERMLMVEDPLGFMFAVMLFGWIFSAAWLIADGGAADLLNMSTENVISLLFLGIACSGLAYAFWYDALRHLKSAQAGAFLYIEPFVTVILAWLLLGEGMSFSAILGGMGIILGVWMVNRVK